MRQSERPDEWAIDGSIALCRHPDLAAGWKEPDGVSITLWDKGQTPIQFPHLKRFEDEFWSAFRLDDKPEDREWQRYPRLRHVYSHVCPQTDVREQLRLSIAPTSYVTWASVCSASSSQGSRFFSPLDELRQKRGGRTASLRQHYGRAVMRSNNQDLPSILFVAMLIVGPGGPLKEGIPDQPKNAKYVILGQNSPSAHEEYGDSWSATFEETCDYSKDNNPFETAKRGLEEEFNISRDHITDLRFLALAVEQPDLSTGLLGIIEIDLPFATVRQLWPGRRDKEHVWIVQVPLTKEELRTRLAQHVFTIPSVDRNDNESNDDQSNDNEANARQSPDRESHGPWHPSSRMRLVLGLGAYGENIDEWCPRTIPL